MKLAELIREENVILDFSAPDKWKAIGAMLDHLIAQGKVKAAQRKSFHDALLKRENVASTGMDHGVALPHAQVDGLEEAVAAIALSAGVNFQSSDGKPARILVLLIIPKQNVRQHIRTLAGIARLLNYEEMREALLAAKSAREVATIIKEEEEKALA